MMKRRFGTMMAILILMTGVVTGCGEVEVIDSNEETIVTEISTENTDDTAITTSETDETTVSDTSETEITTITSVVEMSKGTVSFNDDNSDDEEEFVCINENIPQADNYNNVNLVEEKKPILETTVIPDSIVENTTTTTTTNEIITTTLPVNSNVDTTTTKGVLYDSVFVKNFSKGTYYAHGCQKKGGSTRSLIDCSVGNDLVKGSIASSYLYLNYGYNYNGKRTMVYLEVDGYPEMNGHYFLDDSNSFSYKNVIDFYYTHGSSCPFSKQGVVSVDCWIVTY